MIIKIIIGQHSIDFFMSSYYMLAKKKLAHQEYLAEPYTSLHTLNI